MAMTHIPDSTDPNPSSSIENFLKNLTINGASPNTIRAYKADLTGMMNTATPVSMARNDIESAAAEYLTSRRNECAPNTINRKLACFRKFGRFMGWHDFLAEYRPPKPARGYAHPIPEGVRGVLDMAQIARKPEHLALVALCGMLGLRVGEALKVRPSHFNHDRNLLRVYGKGDKQRDVVVSDSVWQYIMPALLKARRAGDDLLIPLHDRTARRAWSSMARRAGLSHSSTHDGRMTVGTTMYYKSGGDIRAVQEHLGHSSSHTTENYTQVNFDKMKSAADIFEDG